MNRPASKNPQRLPAAGYLLRQWRTTRSVSQQALSLDTGVSTRHLSFVETGRSQPSRELLLKLSAALGMPPRDRNALLSAAGYQPIYRETQDRQGQQQMLRAITLILKQNDPFGAVAVDRDFSAVMVNRGFATFLRMLGAQEVPEPFTLIPAEKRINLLDAIFDPALGIRGALENWEEVASNVLWHARAEMAATRDEHARTVLERLSRHPGVMDILRAAPQHGAQGFVLPLNLRVGDVALSLFTTITTLGTPQDITACELRIESYHPANAETEKIIRQLVDG